MSDNTGTPYETFAQVVFQAIVNQSDVRNIVVRHDVRLPGKYKNIHQIGVYWKFAVNLLDYETVVQAKDWQEPVDQGEMIKFKGVLDDLPGQPKGIFVSRSGFQRGAINYALQHGILIYELREAEEESNFTLPTTGWVRYAVVRMPLRAIIGSTQKSIPQSAYALGWVWDIFAPSLSNINFHVSQSWSEKEHPTFDVSKVGEVRTPLGFLHETALYDKEGLEVGKFSAVFRQIAMDMHKDGVEQKRVTHVFAEPTFIQTNSSAIPYVQIDSVSVDVKVEHRQEIRRGRMSNFAHWVLHELNSGRTEWFGATPSVTSLLPKRDAGALVAGDSGPDGNL